VGEVTYNGRLTAVKVKAEMATLLLAQLLLLMTMMMMMMMTIIIIIIMTMIEKVLSCKKAVQI
jgi:hypothetical protein